MDNAEQVADKLVESSIRVFEKDGPVSFLVDNRFDDLHIFLDATDTEPFKRWLKAVILEAIDIAADSPIVLHSVVKTRPFPDRRKA